MTNYEIIKKMSIEEMAAFLYSILEPFFDGNEELEFAAKIKLMAMLRDEVSKK